MDNANDGRFDRLDRYTGPLTPELAAEGIAGAERNAKELVEEAALLLDHNRFARAVALAVLAIEEAGKGRILRQLVATSDTARLRQLWREFRSHTTKNAMAPMADIAHKSGKRSLNDFRLEDFAPLFAPDADHPKVYDAVKQIALYADCLGNAHWSVPMNVIDRQLAEKLVRSARALATGPRGIDSAAGLALWAKHMSGTPETLSKTRLLSFYADAASEGLVSTEEHEAMRCFLGDVTAG